MSIFKRKKKIEKTVKPPIILSMPKIKPTTCGCCGTVYQANATHFRIKPDACFIERENLRVCCPICGSFNLVEFEVQDDG